MLKEKERNLSFGMITLIIVLFLTIGYSAFERSLLLDDIALTVRPVEDIRVTGTWQTGSTNGAESSLVDYNVKSSLLNIDLPKETSTITYTVQVTNIGNVDMGIYIITGLPKNMEYELTNYTLKEKICNEERCSKGIQKEFQITIKYKEGGYNSTNTKYELKLDYDFRRFYNVKYVNIEGEGYPDSVIEGDPLKVNFEDNAPNKLFVTIGGASTENYSYRNKVLEILSINGDVEISTTATTGIYKEEILHGADPVLKGDLIPVTIDDDGTVHYADLDSEWYKYAEQKWANAVILVGSPNKTYEVGDIIDEQDIESYFVWIPRYKYKIWNTGNYESAYQRSQLTDNETDSDTQLRHVTENARLIEIVFESKNDDPSNGNTVGSYHTHPAFTLGEDKLNGIWVGKFETGYNQNSNTEASITADNIKSWATSRAQVNAKAPERIIVKPNVYSWRYSVVGNFFFSAYNYNRTEDIETNLDSHMMKNTEWGAAAYLSHSKYGIGAEVNINNNSAYKTGYSAAANTDQSEYPGESGTAETVTQPYNTTTGYHASTTGNITGIYDMAGGALEYVAGYKDGNIGSSGLSSADLTTYEKYFDKYDTSSGVTSYNYRILGDATGEMGPFYLYYNKDQNRHYHNGWYADQTQFVASAGPWFGRGGVCSDGVLAGQFYFYGHTGGAIADYVAHYGSRLVLTPQ